MNLKILNIENDCTGCGSCANICPKHCLEMKPNTEGFYYPVYNPADCINCGLCEKTCHVLNPQNEENSSPFFFCYRTKDEKIREKSTSGGAFSLFADYVLSKGGLVFGSVYDGEMGKLVVKNTDCVPINSLRKSKYIESFTSNSWVEIKQSLLNNRQTLFCGTPCQVAGLLSFLRQAHVDTKNLITIDFACHGVPSNKCFSEFIKFFIRGKNTVSSADFRYKDFKKNIGWHNMVLALGLSNGKKKVVEYNTYYYYYYQPFIDDIMLRKCCYHCNRILHSKADFSIGDFWGINEYNPQIDDNKGYSYIKINNSDMVELFKELTQENCFLEELPAKAMLYQYHERNKENKLHTRDLFFENVNKIGYIKAIDNHYGKYNIIKSVLIAKSKAIVKSIIRKK